MWTINTDNCFIFDQSIKVIRFIHLIRYELNTSIQTIHFHWFDYDIMKKRNLSFQSHSLQNSKNIITSNP